MVIALLGASGTGKSTIEHELSARCCYKKIISYTTRQPRGNEKDGEDYHFVNNIVFNEMIHNGLFAEYDEYSQNRLYGTLKEDYEMGNKIVVLTPNGLRQIKRNCPNNKIFSVLIQANLGTRIKRYIDRCGINNFNFEDKNEIMSRVERDFGMFLGLEREVDYVVTNNEGTDIRELVNDILIKIRHSKGRFWQKMDDLYA